MFSCSSSAQLTKIVLVSLAMDSVSAVKVGSVQKNLIKLEQMQGFGNPSQCCLSRYELERQPSNKSDVPDSYFPGQTTARRPSYLQDNEPDNRFTKDLLHDLGQHAEQFHLSPVDTHDLGGHSPMTLYGTAQQKLTGMINKRQPLRMPQESTQALPVVDFEPAPQVNQKSQNNNELLITEEDNTAKQASDLPLVDFVVKQSETTATVTHDFVFKKDQKTKDHAVYALKTKEGRTITLRYSKWLKVAAALNKHMTTSFFRRNRHAAFENQPAKGSKSAYTLADVKDQYEILKTSTNWKSSDVRDETCCVRKVWIMQWYKAWVAVAGEDKVRNQLFDAAVASQ